MQVIISCPNYIKIMFIDSTDSTDSTDFTDFTDSTTTHTPIKQVLRNLGSLNNYLHIPTKYMSHSLGDLGGFGGLGDDITSSKSYLHTSTPDHVSSKRKQDEIDYRKPETLDNLHKRMCFDNLSSDHISTDKFTDKFIDIDLCIMLMPPEKKAIFLPEELTILEEAYKSLRLLCVERFMKYNSISNFSFFFDNSESESESESQKKLKLMSNEEQIIINNVYKRLRFLSKHRINKNKNSDTNDPTYVSTITTSISTAKSCDIDLIIRIMSPEKKAIFLPEELTIIEEAYKSLRLSCLQRYMNYSCSKSTFLFFDSSNSESKSQKKLKLMSNKEQKIIDNAYKRLRFLSKYRLNKNSDDTNDPIYDTSTTTSVPRTLNFA